MTSETKILKVQVQSYSGYRAYEKPISFILDDHKLMVEKVIDQWRTPDFEYFKVMADDNKGYLLRNDEKNDEWVLEKVFER
jgi:hypothetical protein